MSTIFDLPNEVLYEIGKSFQSEKHISSLIRTCQLFHGLLDSYLYRRNVDRGAPVLFYCAKHGLENSTKRLLKLQAKRKMKSSLLYKDVWSDESWDPGSPLYTAAIVSHHASIVRIMLPYVRKQAYRIKVFAPLYDGICWPKEDVVREILEWGKNIGALNRQKTTALCLALRERKIELVKLLIEYGACVNPPLPLADGETDRQGIIGNIPLQTAIIHDCKDFPMAELLLSHGADVNFRDEEGITPLHIFELGDLDDETNRIQWLLKKGADPHIVMDRGFSAFDMAKRKSGPKGEELTKLYLEFGA